MGAVEVVTLRRTSPTTRVVLLILLQRLRLLRHLLQCQNVVEIVLVAHGALQAVGVVTLRRTSRTTRVVLLILLLALALLPVLRQVRQHPLTHWSQDAISSSPQAQKSAA